MSLAPDMGTDSPRKADVVVATPFRDHPLSVSLLLLLRNFGMKAHLHGSWPVLALDDNVRVLLLVLNESGIDGARLPAGRYRVIVITPSDCTGLPQGSGAICIRAPAGYGAADSVADASRKFASDLRRLVSDVEKLQFRRSLLRNIGIAAAIAMLGAWFAPATYRMAFSRYHNLDACCQRTRFLDTTGRYFLEMRAVLERISSLLARGDREVTPYRSFIAGEFNPAVRRLEHALTAVETEERGLAVGLAYHRDSSTRQQDFTRFGRRVIEDHWTNIQPKLNVGLLRSVFVAAISASQMTELQPALDQARREWPAIRTPVMLNLESLEAEARRLREIGKGDGYVADDDCECAGRSSDQLPGSGHDDIRSGRAGGIGHDTGCGH